MAKTEYVVTANHPVDLNCGQMVGPGDVTAKVDDSDHDQQLIEEGALSEKPRAEKQSSPDEGRKDQSK